MEGEETGGKYQAHGLVLSFLHESYREHERCLLAWVYKERIYYI
jgi:hypothetical protein